jgi:biotin operon repressor
MPRPQRRDVEPEILLPDVREQERIANDAIDDDHRAKVRPVDYRPVIDGWTNIFDRTDEMLKFVRRRGVKLDEGLVSFMMRHCARAAVIPVLDQQRQPVTRDGCIVYVLRTVGCRVYLTQDEIAQRYGRSRQHVIENIKTMKLYGLIVNQGQGWYEFDARLCWRGDFQIQKAYREQQRVRDGLVITDGETTLVTEDMDDDEDEPGEAAQ